MLIEKFGEDLLVGVGPIAEFMFGSPTKRRLVYYLAEKRTIPAFRIGERVCARKSTLRSWLLDQESAALREANHFVAGSGAEFLEA